MIREKCWQFFGIPQKSEEMFIKSLADKSQRKFWRAYFFIATRFEVSMFLLAVAAATTAGPQMRSTQS